MKKLLSIFLAIVLVVMQVPMALATDTKPKEEDDKVPTPTYIEKPVLSITNTTTIHGKAGETITLPIDIRNVSKDHAFDIIGSANLAGAPMSISGSSGSIPRLYPGSSSTMSFDIDIDKMAEGKSYPVTVGLTYYNYDRDQFTSAEATFYIKVTNDDTKANVIVKNIALSPSVAVSPGTSVLVGFELENIGDNIAKDIKVSLNGLSGDGFSLVSGLNVQTIPTLNKGKSNYLFYQVRPSMKLKSGDHLLKIGISYKDIKDNSIEDEYEFFIPIASDKNQASNIIIEKLVYPSGPIGINKDVDISFSIRNQGQQAARNVKVEAISEDQSGLVPKTVSTVQIPSLEKGGSQDLSFKFLTTGGATTKNHPVEIKVTYEDDVKEESSINQYVGIFVNAPEENDNDGTKGKPRLIIDRYTFDPQLVKAGENFEMTLSFFNTNSTKAVKNIKIFLTAEAGGTSSEGQNAGSSVFTPVDSSNTFYIDSIPPKGRVEKTITMFTVPDALAKTHTILANFEYEDSQGNPLDDQERIGVPVVQQSKLETGEIGFYPEAYVGQPMPVSLEFYNTGKVTLYNMMVKLEGDFQTENGSYYVGNFDSGASEYFEGMVIPSMPGELSGAVLFTYEDSTGQMQEIRKEFSLNVMDMPPMEEFPDDFGPPMEENSGGILKSKGLWISVVALIGGIGGVIFYKKRKQKKAEEELALDE